MSGTHLRSQLPNTSWPKQFSPSHGRPRLLFQIHCIRNTRAVQENSQMMLIADQSSFRNLDFSLNILCSGSSLLKPTEPGGLPQTDTAATFRGQHVCFPKKRPSN